MPVCLALACWGDSKQPAARWWSHIQFLADDKLEGRDTGTEDHRRAADYVAREFRRAGLKPAGASGYLQPVKFRSRRIVEDQCSLELIRNGQASPLKLGEEANISLPVDPVDSLEAP